MALDEEDRRTLYKMSGQMDSILSVIKHQVDALDRHFVEDSANFAAVHKRIDGVAESIAGSVGDVHERINKVTDKIGGVSGKVKWLTGAWAVAGAFAVYLFKH